jgi:hypothetical protein
MADEKTLEMRVAALEDKLANVQITEEEMRAFNKVSALLAGQPVAGGAASAVQAQAVPALSPTVCVIPRRVIAIRPICYECICGPCNCGPGGGFFGGGGFGTLGF